MILIGMAMAQETWHGHLAREREHGQDLSDVFDRDGQDTNILAVIREWYFGNPKCNGIVTDKYNS
jgi:hypothetical protein